MDRIRLFLQGFCLVAPRVLEEYGERSDVCLSWMLMSWNWSPLPSSPYSGFSSEASLSCLSKLGSLLNLRDRILNPLKPSIS